MELYCKKKYKNFVKLILIICLLPLSMLAKDVEFPLVQSFAYYPYSENDILSANKFSMCIDIYHSNIFTFHRDDNLMNDFELTSFTLGTRYGLTNSITLEVFIRYMTMNGGFLDGFIENFHSFFGLPTAYRPNYSRDIVSYYNNNYFSYSENTGTMSPVILSLLTNIFSEDNFNVKTRIALGIPLKSKPGLSSDKAFLTTGLIFTYNKDRFRLDFSNYLSWFKTPEWFADVELKSKTFFTELRITYKRFLTGFIFKTSPLVYSESSANAYQIQFGYKISNKIEFLILEDFAPFDTSPDISFNLCVKF